MYSKCSKMAFKIPHNASKFFQNIVFLQCESCTSILSVCLSVCLHQRCCQAPRPWNNEPVPQVLKQVVNLTCSHLQPNGWLYIENLAILLWGMLKAPPLIPRTYISWYSKIGPRQVNRGGVLASVKESGCVHLFLLSLLCVVYFFQPLLAFFVHFKPFSVISHLKSIYPPNITKLGFFNLG